MGANVEVLLATYNNGAYLTELLESLISQTRTDFTLIVSDDASTDSTVSLLRDYESRFDGRMRLVERERQSGSAKANFASLMALSQADYVLFADGDDIWHPNKVQTLVDAVQTEERHVGSSRPVMVFSDAHVVDAEDALLHQSYWAYKRIDPKIAASLSRTLVCPPMLGCASACNRALVERSGPVPVDEVTGHDWWLFLVARIFGEAVPVAEPTMRYRLHGQNSSNQRSVGLAEYAKTSGKVARVRGGLVDRIRQAEAVLHRFDAELSADDRRTLRNFVDLRGEGPIKRRVTMLRGGYVYPDLPRNLATLLAM